MKIIIIHLFFNQFIHSIFHCLKESIFFKKYYIFFKQLISFFNFYKAHIDGKKAAGNKNTQGEKSNRKPCFIVKYIFFFQPRRISETRKIIIHRTKK